MPTYTASQGPILKDYAIQLFDSGLALYTGNYSATSASDIFDPGDSIGIPAGSGAQSPFYVYPFPEVASSGTPGLLDFRASAYSRWTSEKKYSRQIVTGIAVGVYAVYYKERPVTDPPTHRTTPQFYVSERPIFHTQTTVKQVVADNETVNVTLPEEVFYESDMSNFKKLISQFNVGNQVFDNQAAADEYALANGGTVVDTSFISIAKKFTDFFPGALSQTFFTGNFTGLVVPNIKISVIQFNQNIFGKYIETEYITSPEQSYFYSNEGGSEYSGTANIIYNFGSFYEKLD